MEDEIKKLLQECTGFQWDAGNKDKNWLKHHMANSECEQIFFNKPFLVHHDSRHSDTEHRFYALGQTDLGRKLFVVFTIRNKQIRIISARDLSKKEREIYRKML
ncbi:BrnT family toxin [Caldithrix abyssi]